MKVIVYVNSTQKSARLELMKAFLFYRRIDWDLVKESKGFIMKSNESSDWFMTVLCDGKYYSFSKFISEMSARKELLLAA